MAIWVSYKELFGAEDGLTLESILSEMPSTAVFQRIAFINSQIHLFEREQLNQVNLFNNWIDSFNQSDKDELLSRLSDFSKKLVTKKLVTRKLMFFTNMSSMTLAQKSLEFLNDDIRQELTPEEEYKCLLAYFMANDLLDEKQAHILNPQRIKKAWPTSDIFLHTQLLLLISQADVVDFNNFVIQLLKGIKLFKFFEKESEFSVYLSDFLKSYGFDTWRDYLLRFADIYGNLISVNINRPEKIHGIIIDPPNDSILSLLDGLSININSPFQEISNMNEFQLLDFKPLRIRPLFKVSHNEYCFLNLNFFVDKLFQSIHFQYFNFIKNNGYNLNYNAFKSKYSFEFIEKDIFYDTMEKIFLKKNCLKVKGQEYSSEYSDYYIRDGHSIFLFELKDYVIKAEIKHSYDFDVLLKDLQEKFIGDEKHKKGIRQLISVIHNIESKKIEFDTTNDNFKKLSNYTIYPIIVFTDITLNSIGLNFLLNKEMKVIIKQEKFQMKVKDLIMIDLNTLIEFQELFINESLNFLELCKNYLDYVNSKKLYREPLQELTSISEFMNFYIQKSGIEKVPPKSFKTSLNELYNDI